MTEHEKRENVIKGLEHELQKRGKCGHYCHDGIETVSCEYDKNGLCIQHWGKDALALLEAQEPVEHGQWQEVHTKARGYGKVWYQHNCSPMLYESPYYYCPFCGSKMDEKKKET